MKYYSKTLVASYYPKNNHIFLMCKVRFYEVSIHCEDLWTNFFPPHRSFLRRQTVGKREIRSASRKEWIFFWFWRFTSQDYDSTFLGPGLVLHDLIKQNDPKQTNNVPKSCCKPRPLQVASSSSVHQSIHPSFFWPAELCHDSTENFFRTETSTKGSWLIAKPQHMCISSTAKNWKIGIASVLLDDLNLGNICMAIFNDPFDRKKKADRKFQTVHRVPIKVLQNSLWFLEVLYSKTTNESIISKKRSY